ncbi:hypothetical protein [Microbacterium deminutum]|uniref:Uncharacterized protein n=1 Tax=Microbacterium deminutum TaxID=344164 RepID=A0ABN2R235_9MICO
MTLPHAGRGGERSIVRALVGLPQGAYNPPATRDVDGTLSHKD